MLQLQHERLLNFQFLGGEATPPLLCVGPIKCVQLFLLRGHEVYFQNVFPLFTFLTFDGKDAHEPLHPDLAVAQPNFSADGFEGDETVAIFSLIQSRPCWTFSSAPWPSCFFSGGGGIGVGFFLLFEVGDGSGETCGDDSGWLVVFLGSGRSKGLLGRL